MDDFSCRVSYMCMPRKDHNVNQNVDFCQRRHSKILERFTVWFLLQEKIKMPDVSFRMCAYLTYSRLTEKIIDIQISTIFLIEDIFCGNE